MDQESWLSCEKTAVLQGGFLLANQLCQPEPLSTVRKEDWEKIGRPIVQAITEICGTLCVSDQDKLQWRKRILCILWSKILEMEKGEDIEVGWKENPLFAVQSSLPQINHTVMFELVKSMGFFNIYVELLQCFQADEQIQEKEKLVRYLTSNSTEADVKFLLDVWWELLKGRREEEDSMDQIFTSQCVRLTKSPADCSLQASKRFKPDPELSKSTTCTQSIFFQGLNSIKDCITSPELCYFALSNCLDMLNTSYLLDHTADIPTEIKLQTIACSISLQKANSSLEKDDLTLAIRDSQRELAAVINVAQSRPCGMTFLQAAQTILEIIYAWDSRGLLEMPTNDPSVLAIRLKDSLSRVIKSLELLSSSDNLDEYNQTVNSLNASLKRLLASSTFTVPEIPSTEVAKVATTILDGHLKGFDDLPKLYASKLSQVCNETEWLSCLERNKGAFLQKDLVITLVSTLIDKCQSNADVQHCKKLKDIIVDIFSQLPLPDKNIALSDILTMSEKGLHGCLPSSVTTGYDEELNLVFNSIIQDGAKSSLGSAVSAVARVAFQNPEATLCRCCQMAVVNLGAHKLLSQILQQLSGLRGSFRSSKDAGNKKPNLLCRCLHATAWSKLSSSQEEDQFLSFISALMEPSITEQEGEMLRILPPEETVNTFVLPHLLSPGSANLELSLKILQSALSHTSSGKDTAWIMSCSPFPLIYCLAQLLNSCSRCWEHPVEVDTVLTIESKELLISVLTTLGKAVGKEVALAPSTWSRAIFWLYEKVEELDWTVRFHLKEVWAEHFKYEVPSSLMTVCELSDQEWSSLSSPQYDQGTGLLAWVECCCLSDQIRDVMLNNLLLNMHDPEEVSMFSKGLLVAVLQALPWCTVSQWERLIKVPRELLKSEKLYVPYSLEYVDFLPFLDLRSFACDLRQSAFLLRIFQLLCGSSCADWLPPHGWAHTGRLYANAMRGIIDSVKDRTHLQSTSLSSNLEPVLGNGNLSQEVLFVLTQLYCHVLHVHVMMPLQTEPLFLCALEILSHYEAVLTAYPKSRTALQGANTRHFLTTITDNLQCQHMKSVLHQKIAQL